MTGAPLKAALIIIGNEILSGRTQDLNTQHIAEKLCNHGIRFVEARVIPDQKDIIIKTVREMREAVDVLLTTGGIGPTHDDITADAIAAAFGVEVVLNEEAKAMMVAHYGPDVEMTEPRLKMARIPEGAALIRNIVSGAPGFIMENVYVMAGVPRIMQAMLDEILQSLKEGPKILSNTVSCTLTESKIAAGLEKIQSQYDDVEIGSYPHYRAGAMGLNLVLRATDSKRLEDATDKVIAMVQSLGQEPSAITRAE